MQASVVSFGYKHGLPLDVDMVFDCRFLPNPHWVDELRPLTGLDDAVRDYVLDQPETAAFLGRARRAVRAAAARRSSAKGKSYLRIAVGCTGGRHRSVVIAEELAAHRCAAHGLDPTVAPPRRRPRDWRRVVAIGGGHGSRPRCGPRAATPTDADRGRVGRRRRRVERTAARGHRAAGAGGHPALPRRARRPGVACSGASFEHRFDAASSTATRSATSLITALAERASATSTPPSTRSARLLGGAGAGSVPATEAPVVLVGRRRRRRGRTARSRCRTSTGIKRVALEPADRRRRAPARSRRSTAPTRSCSARARCTRACSPHSPCPAIRDAVSRSAGAGGLRVQPAPAGPGDRRATTSPPTSPRSRDHGIEPDVVLCRPGALPSGRVDVDVVEHTGRPPDGLAHDPALLGGALSALVGSVVGHSG